MRFASMARLRAGPGVGPLFVAPLFFDNASRRVASRPNSGTACATGGRGPLDRLCRRDAPLATRDSKREQASKHARPPAPRHAAGGLRRQATPQEACACRETSRRHRERPSAGSSSLSSLRKMTSSSDGGADGGRWCNCSSPRAESCGSKAETDCFE